MQLSKRLSMLLVTSIAFLVVACSSQETKPTQLLSEAKSDLRSAEELGSEEYAPLAIRSAKQNLEKAESAISEEEFEKATRYLEKSLVDSELASIKAQAQKSKNAADEIEENLNALKQSQ